MECSGEIISSTVRDKDLKFLENKYQEIAKDPKYLVPPFTYYKNDILKFPNGEYIELFRVLQA